MNAIRKIISAIIGFLRALGAPLRIGKAKEDLSKGARPQDTLRPYEVATEISNTPGLICPQCRHRIAISIPMLLSGQPIFCTNCLLELRVDATRSQESLGALQKLQGDFSRAEEMMRQSQQ